MTTQAQYEKALERAQAEQLEVTLLEAWGAHVRNPKYAEGYYTVRFAGNATTCNCQAGQREIYCKHRALVHAARVAAAQKAAEPTWRLSDRGWRAQYAQEVLATA